MQPKINICKNLLIGSCLEKNGFVAFVYLVGWFTGWIETELKWHCIIVLNLLSNSQKEIRRMKNEEVCRMKNKEVFEDC